MKTTDGVYHQSDLAYSTTEDTLLSLRKNEYKDLDDHKNGMKKTDTDIICRSFD